MNNKRRMRPGPLAMLLALMLALTALMPAGASAAAIALGGKVGFMYVDTSVTLRPSSYGVSWNAIRFMSSDASVASIDDGGVIRAHSPGRTVITVSGGGAQAKCGVVVLPRSVNVGVGEIVSLPNGTVEQYRIRDANIAAVSGSGMILGKQAGQTLLALKYGGQIMIVEVNVTSGANGGGSLASMPAAPAAIAQSKAAQLDCAATASQVVLVEYKGGSNAVLSIHEKRNGAWVQLYETEAYVGKNGIGKTKEGDKKTPTGTYNLTTPFGILEDPGAPQLYTKVTKYHYWCGTSNSGYYNRLVDSREIGRNYTSGDEHLIDYKGVYNYCMFIDYNAAGEPGKGSCIFLHCTGKNRYTAGCVAVRESVMKGIIQWARPGARIVIQ